MFLSDPTVRHSDGGVSRKADTADRRAATAGPQGRSHCHAVVAPLGRRRELINDDARRTSDWVKGGWGGEGGESGLCYGTFSNVCVYGSSLLSDFVSSTFLT